MRVHPLTAISLAVARRSPALVVAEARSRSDPPHSASSNPIHRTRFVAVLFARRFEGPPGPNDLHLGSLAGAPFFVDRDMYRRWREPDFLIDVAPGAADSFSLEGREGIHFFHTGASRDLPA